MNLIVIYLLIHVIMFYVSSEKISIPCIDDSDCASVSDEAKCVESMCNCTGDCFFDNVNVVTKIGQSCVSLQECNVAESYCLDNVCCCKKGTVQSANGKRCLKVSEGIGSECIEDNQCSANTTSSICKNNSCTCEANYHLFHDICLKNRDLGEVCNITEECTPAYSECDVHCRCLKRYVSNGKRCLLAAKTHLSPCEEDVQCKHTLGGASQCKQGICFCEEYHHFSSASKKCVMDKLVGDICMEDEDCHKESMECILGECNCKLPHVQVSMFCITDSGVATLLSSPVMPIFLVFLQVLPIL